MTPTVDREAANVEVVGHSAWPASEEAMCVAIVRAWCRLGSQAERRRHPLGPFVLAHGFVESVASAPVDGLAVAETCAKAASSFPWSPGSGEPKPVPGPPGVGLDPLVSWWRPLSRHNTLGVHYGELDGAVIEFLLVGRQGEGPSGWGLARE